MDWYLNVLIVIQLVSPGASQVALLVKNPPAKAGDIRDVGLIPGSDPLQEGMAIHLCSCQENPMDRGAWQATVHRVTELDMPKVTWHHLSMTPNN